MRLSRMTAKPAYQPGLSWAPTVPWLPAAAYRYGEGYLPVHGSEYRLYQALYTLLPTSFDEHSKRLSFELRDVYTTAMVDFTELVPRSVTYDSDGSFHTHGVARSLYANGTEIVCNFEETSFTYKGKTIAPRDFIILTHLEP